LSLRPTSKQLGFQLLAVFELVVEKVAKEAKADPSCRDIQHWLHKFFSVRGKDFIVAGLILVDYELLVWEKVSKDD